MKRVLLSFLLLAGVYVQSYALTKSQIIGEVRRLVHDTNSQRWTDLQISTFVNMAQDEIVNLTWCLHNKYSFTSVSGTTDYAMPNDFVVPENVYYDGKVLPEISLSKLDEIDESWASASGGTPTYYYINRTSATYMSFYVVPNSSKTVDVYYIEQVDNLVNDNAEPFNGYKKLRPYDYCIILWVAQYCCLQEGKIALATQFYNLYALRIKDMKETINVRPNYYPNISGGGQ